MRYSNLKIKNPKLVDKYILRIVNRSEKAKFHIIDKTLISRIETRLKQLKEFHNEK